MVLLVEADLFGRPLQPVAVHIGLRSHDLPR
jgi:hypothetical protein